jgi:hypothetical protein
MVDEQVAHTALEKTQKKSWFGASSAIRRTALTPTNLRAFRSADKNDLSGQEYARSTSIIFKAFQASRYIQADIQ